MDLAAWLERLEQLHPSAIELGLSRCGEVARRLDLLETPATTVTVAGTTALDLEDWAEFGASWSHELSMGATLTLSGDVLSGNDALSANTVAVEFSMPF